MTSTQFKLTLDSFEEDDDEVEADGDRSAENPSLLQSTTTTLSSAPAAVIARSDAPLASVPSRVSEFHPDDDDDDDSGSDTVEFVPMELKRSASSPTAWTAAASPVATAFVPHCKCGKASVVKSIIDDDSDQYYSCANGQCNFFHWADGSSEGTEKLAEADLAAQKVHRNAYNSEAVDKRLRREQYFKRRVGSFACQQPFMLGQEASSPVTSPPATKSGTKKRSFDLSISPYRPSPSSNPLNGTVNALSSSSHHSSHATLASSSASSSSFVSSSSASPNEPKRVKHSSSRSRTANLNAHITDLLEELSSSYKSKGDQWRKMAADRSVSALKRMRVKVTDVSQVRGKWGFGDSMCRKVDEILRTGDLQKLVVRRPKDRVLNLFSKVWGAGPRTVENWYARGFRTLEDLHAADEKGELTEQQSLGLRYYDDLQLRIPRDEVRRIEEAVASELHKIDKNFQLITCGSYRRGRPDCGDVDILISHPDPALLKPTLQSLLPRLHSSGFLVADLSVSLFENGSTQCKYMGICRLPGTRAKARRLDLITVPPNELAPALLYFTGNGYFNRSMRHYADKMGMSLSQHGLAPALRVKGKKVASGTPLPCSTEQEIFERLGIQYVPPEKRDPSK